MGLATGGAGSGGSLDVGNFCCPDYLQVMARRITEQWNSRQGVSGMTVMRFTIQRDGRITDIGTEQSGGYVLDLAAQRALLAVGRVPQLPPAFTHPSLTVYLRFEYKR
jgi:TonB family protein